MILEKNNAVLANRELMGATNPKDAEKGTIRKKYGISIDKNSVHGSDSVENAKIKSIFFSNFKIKLFLIALGYIIYSCFNIFLAKILVYHFYFIFTFFVKQFFNLILNLQNEQYIQKIFLYS